MARRERLPEPHAISPLERALLVDDPGALPKPAIAPLPKSNVLDKLRNFLPEMQAANQQLERDIEQHGQEHVDLEALPAEHAGPVIQVDLACGLFELRNDASLAAAERAMAAGGPPEGQASASSSDAGSDSDDSDGSEDEAAGAEARAEPGSGTGGEAAPGAGRDRRQPRQSRQAQQGGSNAEQAPPDSGPGAGAGRGSAKRRKQLIHEL